MKKKSENNTNYLDKIPQKNSEIKWHIEKDLVVLEIENKGLLNRIFQLIARKPKMSYIHLDEFGSYIWNITDGEKSIEELGKLVSEKFGEKANPLYERLATYFNTLKSYNFIIWK